MLRYIGAAFGLFGLLTVVASPLAAAAVVTILLVGLDYLVGGWY